MSTQPEGASDHGPTGSTVHLEVAAIDVAQPQGQRTDAAPAVLEIDDVSVIHPGRGLQRGQDVTAVDRVSLRVREAEIVGLVGESGSGKSTLALASAGLGRLTSGRIDILGRPVTDLGTRRSLRDHRAQVQMVFQDPHGSLDPRQTVGGGFRELRRLHPNRTAWIEDAELMQRVGLDPDLLDRLPHQVSGGQAQRVSVARALLLRPRLLIADEPTSGLDVSVQAQIVNLLLRIRDEERLGILFISHDLSVVRHLCDHVHVMKDGRIVEAGPTEALLSEPGHPYTQRLIAAVPGRQLADNVAVVPVPGETEDRASLPSEPRA